MTPAEVANVQRTFSLIAPIAEHAGHLFYGRLFELNPSIRSMFTDDVAPQAKKLMQVLAVAANGLGRPATLVPVVEALGARHIHYGVQDEHYGVVGEALMWTLRQGLKDEFTPEVEKAWAGAYALLSSIMKDAARRASGHSKSEAE